MTCIEPQEEAQKPLRELMLRHPNVRVIHALLGRKVRDKVPFADEGPGSSVLLPGGRETCGPMETIDSLMANGICKPPQFLKLDVQGYEIEVLEGFTCHFQECEVIKCETSLLPLIPQAPLLHEVVAYLYDRKFMMFDGTKLIRSPSDAAVWQIDALFCRKVPLLRENRVWRSSPTQKS